MWYKLFKVSFLSKSANKGAINIIAWGLPPSKLKKWCSCSLFGGYLLASSGYLAVSGVKASSSFISF